MFDWFRNWFTPRGDVASDVGKIGNDMNKVMPEIQPIPPIPNIPTNQVKDHYRIGYDSANGATTLTLIADYTSMTLSLGPEEVMRLIRMLGATLDDEDIIGGIQDDDYEEDE